MKHSDSTQKSRSRRPGNPMESAEFVWWISLWRNDEKSEVCCQKTIKSSIDSLTYQFFAESLSVIPQKKNIQKVVITPHKTDFWTSTFACRLDHQSQIFGLKSRSKSPRNPNKIPKRSSQGPDRTTTFSLANSPWPCPTGCIDVTWV